VNRLAERVCLITGSTGIAAATARRAAMEGADVFVVSRTADHARALATMIADAGGSGAWASADLADVAATEAAVDACVMRFGRIDGVFSVAGGSGRRFGDGPLHAVSREAWERTLELNLTTQAVLLRAVLERMRGQPVNSSGTRGSVLLMGSVTATDPAPEFFATHAYAAAKGALTALMTTMAAAYLADRIRVNLVSPGLTDTPMATRAGGDDAIRAYAARKQPLAGEMMDPDEVAKAAIFLLSDESRAITGQMLKVDGGWSVASVSPEAPRPAPASTADGSVGGDR
jgi:NAD(P)-dependent dehydrogenase (short-subunit alcohol dehydrogenase family)